MTTGAIIVLVLGVFATIAFALYAANNLEDDGKQESNLRNKQN